MRGSELIGSWPTDPKEREGAIFDAYASGYSVGWPMLAVQAGDVTFFAATNYFAIGEPDDLVFMPMSPITAQRIADKTNAVMLPTKKMVDLIWEAAAVRVEPEPWGPPYDASMLSTARFVKHSERVVSSLNKATPFWRTKIVAGTKKDVVLTNALDAKHVAIYGWHKLSGVPIQGLNFRSHEATYADYSHGIRFVQRCALYQGKDADLAALLSDPKTAPLLSSEGPLHVLRQPGVDLPDASNA